jgi:Na+/H+-dicarboxylate symporter
VLSAANLPLEGLAFIIAIDRVIDMVRTMTNVTGQMLVPVLVARETGMLDMEQYQRAVAPAEFEGAMVEERL